MLTVRIDFGRLIALLLVLGIVITVVMWPLSLWGHAIHLTPSWDQLLNRDKEWMHEHYPLVGLRYVGAAVLLLFGLGLASVPFWGVIKRRAAVRQRQALLAHQRWLGSPPPPLQLPARFTQRWIEENVPYLHPRQVPALIDELHARGWKDDRIAQRVAPYCSPKSA
jgi:hypothetical protein